MSEKAGRALHRIAQLGSIVFYTVFGAVILLFLGMAAAIAFKVWAG